MQKFLNEMHCIVKNNKKVALLNYKKIMFLNQLSSQVKVRCIR